MLLNYYKIVLILLISVVGFAQKDIVLKTNGEEMQGKLIKMNENDLMFVYKNETVEYSIKFSDISKITFAYGRVQNFKNTLAVTSKPTDHHNKSAILPFAYLKDQETSNAIMTQKIQQETYKNFQKNRIQIQFQDPLTANALLAKAGINDSKLQTKTTKELCKILGVEYIFNGLVTIEKTTVTNSSYGSVDVKQKAKTTTANSSSYDYSTQNYATAITTNV